MQTPRAIDFSVTGEPDGLTIEPMVLVPLVENCFKHGNLDTDPAAYVRLMLRIDSNQLHFVAVNTKEDSDRQKDPVGGVGLDNIRERLALQYPGRHQFAVAEQRTGLSGD